MSGFILQCNTILYRLFCVLEVFVVLTLLLRYYIDFQLILVSSTRICNGWYLRVEDEHFALGNLTFYVTYYEEVPIQQFLLSYLPLLLGTSLNWW